MTTLTETLDNLYTTTWQNMKSDVADNIFDATPFWFWMKENGRLEAVEGGRFLTEPLRFAGSDNVTFVSKGEAVPLADKEFLTVAKDDWKYLTDTIVRFGVDDQQNRGKNEILNLMKAKLENSRDSMVDRLELVMAGTAAAKEFNGLKDIVHDTPTLTGATLHGIDPSVETWWRNQVTDMTALLYANIKTLMIAMINNCGNNLRQDRPDLIIGGQETYELYWEDTLDQRRIVNKTLGDIGFQNIEFQGIPWIWSPDIEGTVGSDADIYVLNTNFLRFKYDPMMFFDMTEWKAIPAQINDRAAQVVLAGQLMTSRRRVHGRFHDIAA